MHFSRRAHQCQIFTQGSVPIVLPADLAERRYHELLHLDMPLSTILSGSYGGYGRETFREPLDLSWLENVGIEQGYPARRLLGPF